MMKTEVMIPMVASGLLLVAGAQAQESHSFALDVTAILGVNDYTPDQIVRSLNPGYVVEQQLPSGTEPAALHRRSDGDWLFAPGQTVTLGGTDYEARDLVLYDESTYSLFLDGNAVGVPDYAHIDTVLTTGGDPVLSFDVPVNLDSVEYGRSDLVLYETGVGFALFWDAAAAGIPVSTNVVGAALDATGAPVLTFDVPTLLGVETYLPGELVRWDGVGFSSFFEDTGWPASAQVRDFSFDPLAGVVPNGDDLPGVPLMIGKAAGGDLSLSWGASCNGEDLNYEIYEGRLGNFTSHEPILCSTGGSTSQTITPGPRDTYYLVVPRNELREGSYGFGGPGERGQGASACLPQGVGACS